MSGLYDILVISTPPLLNHYQGNDLYNVNLVNTEVLRK